MGTRKNVIIGETPETENTKISKKPAPVDEKTNIPAQELKSEISKKPAPKRLPAKKKIRSRRFQELKKKIDSRREYALDEATKLIQGSSSAKFDETIEVHIQLAVKKGDTSFRETIEMPGGLAKIPRVALLTDEKIEEVKKGKINFDVALARPEQMAKVAEIARILGPKGLMPNPKLGTITDDPETVKQKLEKNIKEVKADQRGIIHASIGKVSWESNKIAVNFSAILAKINRAKIEKIVLCSTMGAGVKVKI